ncbi:DEAD/DEAH box helicase [Natronobacterium gregoryi]|uniref:Putative DNA 3'-5' helicase Rad25 n=2 Tax=Natronobacterium gregoryi TaxID=44930 RepID=L0ANN5_NATGS|nr:DEAD/DEAH box helicase [Natronobacterium gregoryi]AFZ74675.1 DNA/RNA helicase, superfamily II [Natronobacterium gregoryi SP2]ELY73420.1 type III restriction protein res subunit [Natronobacterium gregoryi SP2]PLK20921.1 ATP-dependent helicase [Natronobacterium gregoryi SP2]SFJ05081.1 DNA excision repair protein ERCC-3 [Natronobacterium gregoryi]
MTRDRSADDSDDLELTIDQFHDACQQVGRPMLTADGIARTLDRSQDAVSDELEALVDRGDLESFSVTADPIVWYPANLEDLTEQERIVVFPKRREIVVDQPTQFTRAQLSQFAHLADANGKQGYRYVVRPEDVWQAPHEAFDDLARTMRQALGQRSEPLEEWVRSQWDRAHQFQLTTHEDGYTVLEAKTPEVMGNVARQKLDEEHVHAPISDTEDWVREGAAAAIKRILYEAGYPVQDHRDLDSGELLDVDLAVSLRDYQQTWVDRFAEAGEGVFVGPPGSGKTVAAMGAMAEVGGETLVLVPSRDLARQWAETIEEYTNLGPHQIGQYHGGQKHVRPVTIATYQIAGMDRHRSLFDDREWGLVIFDECQHVPSDVYRRSTHLQSQHRLGLSASPIREDDRQTEIFTLVGPPIGTDWQALFDAGFVAEPELEIRYVPWGDDQQRNAYASADGRERYRIAAKNHGKIDEVRYLLRDHHDAKALVFVDYLEQGRELAEALDGPFLSGETPHHERRRLLEEFRRDERDLLVVSRVGDEGIDLPTADLAIVASGLGGSRRQGTQRAGRTMRPAGGALVYVLATRGTREEEFARRQLQHLGRKGMTVREQTRGQVGSNETADSDN